MLLPEIPQTLKKHLILKLQLETPDRTKYREKSDTANGSLDLIVQTGLKFQIEKNQLKKRRLQHQKKKRLQNQRKKRPPLLKIKKLQLTLRPLQLKLLPKRLKVRLTRLLMLRMLRLFNQIQRNQQK